MNLQQTVTQLFTQELTKLNYAHMDKLPIIVEDYITHLYEENIFVKQHGNFTNHITNHIKHRAQVLKDDEGTTWEDIEEDEDEI